jgi:circadian clock protein KaiC
MKQGTVTKLPQLDKCPTGITGLDEIINGGVPKGRTTLVAGGENRGDGEIYGCRPFGRGDSKGAG